MTVSKNNSLMSKIPLTFDSIGTEEKSAAIEVLNSGRYTMGEKVTAFEGVFADYVGAKNCVMVNSGSSANLLLASSLIHGIAKDNFLVPGDEVLLPALLWPTTLWPIKQLGLTPVFVDVCPETLAIDPAAVEHKITARTKALFLIHVMGIPANMDKILSLVDNYKLILLEDCCESLGATFKGKHVGNFGLGGTFSFFFSHHISTMEGGAIVTNCDRTADDLRSMRAHGWVRDRKDNQDLLDSNYDENIDPRWLFVLPGFNLRPTEVQAAIGIEQVKRLPKFVAKRRALVEKVGQEIEEDKNIILVGGDLQADIHHSSWMNIPFKLDPNSNLSKIDTLKVFEKYGFETRPVIAGNFFMHPAGQSLNVQTQFPITDEIHRRGFLIGAFVEDHELFLNRLRLVRKELCNLKNS